MKHKTNYGFLLLIISLLFDTASFSQKQQPILLQVNPSADSLTSKVKRWPVAPFGETLFYLYSGLGPFSPNLRAKALEKKIKELADNPFFIPDSLVLVEYESTYNIVFRGMMVSTITIRDSIAESKSTYSIAKNRLEKIVHGVEKYRELNSKENMIKSIVFSGLVIILLIVFFIIVNRLFRYFNKKIDTWQGTKRLMIKTINYDFFDKARQIIVLRFLNKLLRITLFLILLILGLLSMFYFLPWTKGFTLQVIQYLLNPVKSFFAALWAFFPNFLAIIVILVIMTYINRFFRFLRKEVERGALKIPGFYPEWALPTFNIIRVVVWMFSFIVIWPYIPGSDSKIFQGISVFLGLVFSLTSASLLSNVMAGFSLTYTRAFKLGDRIKVGEMIGDVVEKSMLVTKIKTIKNEEITIPNSKIMSSEVINYNTDAQSRGLILNSAVTIGYDAPWRTVHDLLISAALATEGIMHSPKPFVFQTSLDDYYVTYQINAYTQKPNEMARIYSDLHQNIQDKFNAGGIEIMSPAYRSIRDGNATTIPESYLSHEYEAPAFRIKNESEKS
jgi:small-conductance mechanosensitive channel